MGYYILEEEFVKKILDSGSITEGNIDLRMKLRTTKPVEIAKVDADAQTANAAAESFDKNVRAFKELFLSYETTVKNLRIELTETAADLEHKTKELKVTEEELSNERHYDFETSVCDWELRYSAENLWVQEMMEVVIDYANAKGTRHLIDQLKFKK